MIRKLFRLCGALLVLDVGAVSPVEAQPPSESVTVRHAPYTIQREVLDRPFGKDILPRQRITVKKDVNSGDPAQAMADSCRELNRHYPQSTYMTVGPDDCAGGATAQARQNRAER
jgi:hypothetical protein